MSPEEILCLISLPLNKLAVTRQREGDPQGVGQLWSSLPQDVMGAKGEGRIPFTTYKPIFSQVGI